MPNLPRRAFFALLPVVLAALACSQFGPQPTLPPPPASPSASPSPGPETPTPRPDNLTQPAATEATPDAPPEGTPLPPLGDDVFAPVAAIEPDVPGTIQSLRFTPDGTLWLLTDQAVARLAGEVWEIYASEFDGVLVGLDDLSRVWVASPDGASIEAWNGTDWQVFGAGEGWAPVAAGENGAAVRPGVFGDQQGRMWLATASDVRAFDGEAWQVYDRAALGMAEDAAGEASAQFAVHVARSDGMVWVAQCDRIPPGPSGGGGIRFFDGAAWQGAGTLLDEGCGGALASSPLGRVWMGLDDLVLEYDPATGEFLIHESPAPPSGERFGYVADLALDLAERPWPLMAICGGASCDAGSMRYQISEDGTWTQAGAISEAEQALLFDVTGSGWLLSEAGAQRISDGATQTAGAIRVLASAADSGGQIYVAAERDGALGLWIITPGGE